MFASDANNLDSSSIIDILQLYWNNSLLCISDTFTTVRELDSKIVLTFIKNILESFYFTDFQLKLLKTFSIILVINLLLIVTVWKIYGKSICERFMKISTIREIEELKASVSKLKLPKEHTPRI
ncbi:hypothetical protein NQ317_005312 [Molorchus minor]|uniref:Uncharacterized protein n=1 Tax=Molorchus minor TaxID=1323400 RepID=A0ABQ9JXX9_9CUCU|nr:hypothetical protein NQ317_005312 [Molorchus minor]